MEKFKIKKDDRIELYNGSTGYLIGFNYSKNEILLNENFRNNEYHVKNIKKVNDILVEKEEFEYIVSEDESRLQIYNEVIKFINTTDSMLIVKDMLRKAIDNNANLNLEDLYNNYVKK